jgi:hypothetical protein
MTSKVIEAEIILLVWLFTASIVSFSTVGFALAIQSETSELASFNLEQKVLSAKPQECINCSQPSIGDGEG